MLTAQDKRTRILNAAAMLNDGKPLRDGLIWQATKRLGWIICDAAGHPDMPKPRKRWRGTLWRCERCEREYVIARSHSEDYLGSTGGYVWKEVGDA